MRKLLVATLVAATLAAGGMASAHAGVYVTVAPPVPLVEVVPPPRHGYVWVPGFWEWRGHRHSWVAGHWLRERPGYAWFPSRWVAYGNRWRYEPGYWGRHHR